MTQAPAAGAAEATPEVPAQSPTAPQLAPYTMGLTMPQSLQQFQQYPGLGFNLSGIWA